MIPLRIAFAGTPEFAVPALNALAESRHRLVGVLTQPDRPKGRGQQVSAGPVKQAAVDRALPVSQPATLKTEAGRAELLSWQPDVLVVVAYGLILPPAALNIPRLGCVNIHASLLPRWRGAAPIQRAILAGDPQSGITIIQMDTGLDTGPVLLARPVALAPEETGGSLHDRLSVLGAAAVVEALDGLARGSLLSRPQPENGVTYAAKIDKSEAWIEWADCEQVHRKVRAFNPWPVAQSRLDGEVVRIHGARRLASAELSACGIAEDRLIKSVIPGEIVAVHADCLVVACGRGYLGITVVQRPGRRPVAAREFANTAHPVGRRFE